MITKSTVSAAEWEAGTGWHLEESGWCEGNRCIPLRGLSVSPDGSFEAEELAHAMSRGVFALNGRVAIGPEYGAESGNPVGSLIPDVQLVRRDGEVLHLRSLVGRGRRMVLHAWAPW